jgi:uncharacterized repeat protein (TIGR02543 family)
MGLHALLASLVVALTPQFTQVTHTITFVIVNDLEQTTTVEVADGSFFYDPPQFLARDNVTLLNFWYTDEALTQFHDFDFPVTQSLTLYNEWRYRSSSIQPATLRQSATGNRFQSQTMTIYFDLFSPMAVNVRYQWQAAPLNNQDFEAISGANEPQFSPFRNGTFQYRLRYRVPTIQDDNGEVAFITYFSEVITITIFGQQTNFFYYFVPTLIMLGYGLYFLIKKRAVYYEVGEGNPLSPSYYRVGEDTSLLPRAKKKGFIFKGWYSDEAFTSPFTGNRMPLKSFKLYAKFKKINKKR